ncbi:hypothetical protein NP233_g9735 [Leucocoprinus birnbaumii]|uniref:Calcium uniporter protein, mitochondrial n=1 Tax=Leucocoprinus birnbaumii TaxID=56174 RepID=A0AAD5VK31_9AGAR|nr:hypothetical protein NP233_g9735 [Leucocoprinus birnbaumii]
MLPSPQRLGLCWKRTFPLLEHHSWLCHPHSQTTTRPSRVLPPRLHKRWKNGSAEKSDLDASHSLFVAERAPDAKWQNWKEGRDNGVGDWNGNGKDDLGELSEGKGKLASTSSHLFKLILPLGQLSHPGNHHKKPTENSDIPVPPPTVFLLHPSQPLSHVSRLILASLMPATPVISFRSLSQQGQAFQWSDSTDVGDFVRDAARAAEFRIVMTYTQDGQPKSTQGQSMVVDELDKDKTGIQETEIRVEVPTFAHRTRFLRRKLALIEARIKKMEVTKKECDDEAHRGAKRLAVGGFGMLVVYWGAVARLTFWDYGWDIMEPITYLSGLTTVILGYLWFLYQGREVSYSSVLSRSISNRRDALYQARGIDVELWSELLTERRNLRKEIGRIAEDYDEEKNNKDK